MNIPINKTLKQIDHCLNAGQRVDVERPRKAYNLTLKLQSQLLGVIYDMETFTLDSSGTWIAADHSHGQNDGEAVTLTINEALPPMKRLTEAIQEHWKAMIHEAIDEAAQQKPLPYI